MTLGSKSTLAQLLRQQARKCEEYAEILSQEKLELVDSLRQEALCEARTLVELLATPKERLSEQIFAVIGFALWMIPKQKGYKPNLNMCIRVALEMDLFRLLLQNGDRSMTIDQLQAKRSLLFPTVSPDANGEVLDSAQRDMLTRILRATVASGLIEEIEPEVFTANSMTRALAEPANAAMFKHCFDIVLPSLVQTPTYLARNNYTLSAIQTPFQYSIQTAIPYFDWLVAHPPLHDRFNIGMQGNRLGKPFWAAWYPVQERLLCNFDLSCSSLFLVDVGGNTGYDLLRFQEELEKQNLDERHVLREKRSFVLQDLPRVIDSIPEETGQLLDDAGVRREKYDFFEPQSIRGAHVYFMHFILHDFPDSTARQILYNTAVGMKPNSSVLLLNEIVLPPRLKVPLQMALWDVQMMIVLGGQERTEKDWRALVHDVQGPSRGQTVKLEIIRIWKPHDGLGEGIIEIVRRV
ncbi:MAG: hypothetical protein Q9216_002288 [Gyalolechia sp. 2 TL-2023]